MILFRILMILFLILSGFQSQTISRGICQNPSRHKKSSQNPLKVLIRILLRCSSESFQNFISIDVEFSSETPETSRIVSKFLFKILQGSNKNPSKINICNRIIPGWIFATESTKDFHPNPSRMLIRMLPEFTLKNFLDLLLNSFWIFIIVLPGFTLNLCTTLSKLCRILIVIIAEISYKILWFSKRFFHDSYYKISKILIRNLEGFFSETLQ